MVNLISFHTWAVGNYLGLLLLALHLHPWGGRGLDLVKLVLFSQPASFLLSFLALLVELRAILPIDPSGSQHQLAEVASGSTKVVVSAQRDLYWQKRFRLIPDS